MTILIFFIVLFILVLVHEWGHFIVAKKSGIRIDEFGIGFPPKAFGWKPKNSETEYSLNWLPIGGFVRIFGEDPNDESLQGADRERAFINKPAYTRALVLVAGVTMNIILAYALYVVAFTMGILMSTAGIQGTPAEAKAVITKQQIVVYEVVEQSPAEKAGISSGDLITGIEGVPADTPFTSHVLTSTVEASEGNPVILYVNSNGEEKNVELVAEKGVLESNADSYAIGVSMGDVAIVSYSFTTALIEAGKHTGSMLMQIVVGLGTFFKDVFTLNADLSSVSGPVGIVSLVGDASSLGFVYLLSFMAFISLNLAVINMLPFPALDGGRLLFLVIEKIKGSAMNPKIANLLNYLGFAVLLLLMVAVTVSDVIKLF